MELPRLQFNLKLDWEMSQKGSLWFQAVAVF